MEGEPERKVLLHVEDIQSIREAFLRWMGARLPGVEVVQTGGIDEAERLLEARTFDAIVLDLGLPRSQGIGTFRRVLAASHGTPILAHTGSEVDDYEKGLIAASSAGYFQKGSGEMQGLLRRLEEVLGSPEMRLSENQLSELLRKIDEASARLDRTLHRLEAGVGNGTA